MRESCDFCAPTDDMESRIVRRGQLSYSMVSNPSFRDGQTLVIPNRHVRELHELTIDELAEIQRELGRIAAILDVGYGYEILQKFQPSKPDDEIKRDHAHIHVIPRHPTDGILSVPSPNTPEGFRFLAPDELRIVVEKLRP